MSNYSVPAEIRQYKPEGTMVKKLGKGFYVYEHTSSKETIIDPDGKKKRITKNTIGKCVGSITLNDGFIPNNNYLHDDEICSKHYGDYALAIKYSTDTYNRLTTVFNLKDAQKIYCVALIFFVEGFTYMKKISSKYETSYLSYCFPDISLGYDALRTLYSDLGTRNKRVIEFEQSNIDNSSKKISIDGHVIACTSEKNDLSEFGYKFRKYGTPQMNWITAYDIDNKKTLTSAIVNGSEPDKISVLTLFERHVFTNTEFLVDRGYNTEYDKELMSKDGNTYIVPMISSRNDYKKVIKDLKFDKRRYFVYKKKKYSSIIYYQEFIINGIRCIAYKDATRELSERENFLDLIDKGKKGYTEKTLIENDIYFGLFLLETNIPATKYDSKTIFEHYKERWAIETFYNYVRNKCDFNAIYQQDYFMCQGLSFIITITCMIFNEVQYSLEGAKKSIEDIFNTIGKLKINKYKNRWHVVNNIKSVRQMCQLVGFEIPKTID